jgi:dihydroxy-acid dehydratase
MLSLLILLLAVQLTAQIHITAIARHVGVELETDAWQQVGYDIPLMANIQPAGEYLCESYHRAGGTAAIMSELLANDKIHGDVLTVTGKRMSDNLKGITIKDEKVITPFNKPMKQKAGFVVLKGNLFDAAIMKTSVISKSFKDKFLSRPGKEGILEGNVIVFEGSEDYHDRLNDKSLNMNENSILVIRGAGPVGWPGSAEVVNMQPSDDLIKQGNYRIAMYWRWKAVRNIRKSFNPQCFSGKCYREVVWLG